MKAMLVILIFVFSIGTAFAGSDQSVGQVGGNSQQVVEYRTYPVYHDTTGRTDADLTDRELHFLSTVPTAGGLRDAVREMVLANVVHVPASSCGNYRRGQAVHYWSIYQAWTGPAKVTIPLIKGSRGERGEQGPQGPVGPQGPAGQRTIINNYSFGCLATPSYQLGGAQAPILCSTGIASVGWSPVSRISMTTIAIAKAPTNIDIAVSQQQQQQQQQQQDQSVVIDP
ncbi:MAG: hypothetical protein US94_C0030G0002 [Berkelbacteria bacterium GW2011_GWB1_38_5]|uniref:Uncharacterized protein n=2 Tax=Candidatus Berkelbacteria TaxID=1618330 RepID=A0A0G0I1J7_9BACT|nr:MAG: hypothetical protein US31_C0009G0008 [Berkelbacteria bacterium GW2011_GWA1_36_9]KKQ73618.1 MAG: hypothetical protein US94_C0030G0002 [Berkelbacteria bacterium GW2011_GWB1_38_5]